MYKVYYQAVVYIPYQYQYPVIIPIYGRALSIIEKALQKLIEDYQEVRKFLWNLLEGQKRNMAQLAKIGPW